MWRGFVFVRLEDRGGPSVAAMMAPYDAEIAPYRFEDVRAIGRVTRAAARGQLEECRRQLFRRPAHPRRARRADAAVRQVAMAIEARAMGRQDVGRPRRPAVGQPVGALLPGAPAARRPSAAERASGVALLQAVAEHGVRHLPRPDRLHAVAADLGPTADVIARDRLSPCPTTGAR